MAISRRTGRSRLTLVLLVLTSITVLTLDFRGSSLITTLRDGASRVFSPVRGATDHVTSPVADVWNGLFHYHDVKSENDRLHAEIDQLRGAQAQNQDAAAQLEALSELDHVQQWTTINGVDARVVAGPLTNFEHTIELDKGADAGLQAGMPVVTGAGLVGRVTDVQPSRSVVKLLSDPDVVVGIRLNSSGETGLLHGQGDGRPLVIDEGIGPKVTVPPNELVTTSGADRANYPGNVPIGTVTQATLSDGQLQQVLSVDPIADLSRVSVVRVLLWKPAP